MGRRGGEEEREMRRGNGIGEEEMNGKARGGGERRKGQRTEGRKGRKEEIFAVGFYVYIMYRLQHGLQLIMRV